MVELTACTTTAAMMGCNVLPDVKLYAQKATVTKRFEGRVRCICDRRAGAQTAW